MDSVPGAHKRHPHLPRCACADLRYARPSIALPLHSGGGNPPLALAAPAGVGLGQGVTVKQPRRNDPSEETTQNTKASNIATLPSAPKPQTSKEVIADNVKLLIEQLEAGHSEGLTAYLSAMGKFHNYSFGNILEIARQMPTSTRVAGLYA